MKKSLWTVALLSLAAISCNQKKEEKNEPAPAATVSAVNDTASKMVVDENPVLVKLSENRFDPVCNMPVTAGVSDTLTYQGHVLGFCSPDCKSEFVKDPKAYAVEYRK